MVVCIRDTFKGLRTCAQRGRWSYVTNSDERGVDSILTSTRCLYVFWGTGEGEIEVRPGGVGRGRRGVLSSSGLFTRVWPPTEVLSYLSENTSQSHHCSLRWKRNRLVACAPLMDGHGLRSSLKAFMVPSK